MQTFPPSAGSHWVSPPLHYRMTTCQRTTVFSFMCGVYVQGESADVEKCLPTYIKQLVKTWRPMSAGTDPRISALDRWWQIFAEDEHFLPLTPTRSPTRGLEVVLSYEILPPKKKLFVVFLCMWPIQSFKLLTMSAWCALSCCWQLLLRTWGQLEAFSQIQSADSVLCWRHVT